MAVNVGRKVLKSFVAHHQNSYLHSSAQYRLTLELLFKLFANQYILVFNSLQLSPHEKCPYTEFFKVLVFPFLDWVRRFTMQISVLNPNARKYKPEKRKQTAFRSFSWSVLLKLLRFVKFLIAWYELKSIS